MMKEQMNRQLRLATMAAVMGAMMAGGNMGPEVRARDVSRAPDRTSHPWDGVHLSKAERKGKTPEELQALRREKWEAGRG